MARANNSGENEVEVLTGNVWEAITSARLKGNNKTNDKTYQNLSDILIGKKKTEWSM